MRAEGVLRALLDESGTSVLRAARRGTPSQFTIMKTSEAMVVLVVVYTSLQ